MSVYMFKITISKDMVVGGDKSNFPILFDSRISTIPVNFWINIIDPNGLDIRFYDDEIKTNEFSREIVYFNTAPNKIEAWIQIPTLLSATDTELFCEVGAGNRVNDTDIWDDINAINVYHFDGNANDSAVGASDGTVYGCTEVAGKFGNKAYLFDGVDDRIEVPNIDFFHDEISFEAWVKLKSNPPSSPLGYGNIATIFGRTQFCNNTRGWRNFSAIVKDTGLLGEMNSHTIDCSSGSNSERWDSDSTELTIDTYKYIVLKLTNNTNPAFRSLQIYVDGQLVLFTKNDPGPVNIIQSVNDKTLFGAVWRFIGGTYIEHTNIEIEEAKIYNALLSTDWVETVYNNQAVPDTYITCIVTEFDPIPFNIIYRLKRAGNLDKPDSSLFSWLVGSGGHFDAPAAESGVITDHIARAQALLIEQFENKENIKTLLGIYIKQLQDIEYVVSNMGLTRNLAVATGAQLDIIGDRIGEDRQFRIDDDYRTAIRSRIFLNSSNGEPETIIEAIRVLTNATRVYYFELQPATILLQYRSDFLPPSNLQTQIEQIALAGVQVLISYINNPDPIFGFDGEGPKPPSQGAAGFSEEGYAPGGTELGGQFIELIT